VWGHSVSGKGVEGESNSDVGVKGESPTGGGGLFSGHTAQERLIAY